MGGVLEDDRLRIQREQRIRPEPPEKPPKSDNPPVQEPREGARHEGVALVCQAHPFERVRLVGNP